MFADAIELVGNYTKPLKIISRNYKSTSIIPGTATLFFVNDEGYAITCKHVAEILLCYNHLVVLSHFQIILLFVYTKHKKFDGEIFFLYLVGYGLGRIYIEGLRTDSLYIGNYRISQIVSLVLIIIGIIGIIYIKRKCNE